ncbi:unnamed protein product, partial [Staurois parvus]
MYVKCFDTVIFYYVILVNLVNVTFKIFTFPASSAPVRPDVAGNGTPKTDAGIGQRTLPGTLQGKHCGSAGQGKCRRNPGAMLQGIPECSSGLPLVLHSGIPPGRL